jgi:hypothetical protein
MPEGVAWLSCHGVARVSGGAWAPLTIESGMRSAEPLIYPACFSTLGIVSMVRMQAIDTWLVTECLSWKACPPQSLWEYDYEWILSSIGRRLEEIINSPGYDNACLGGEYVRTKTAQKWHIRQLSKSGSKFQSLNYIDGEISLTPFVQQGGILNSKSINAQHRTHMSHTKLTVSETF